MAGPIEASILGEVGSNREIIIMFTIRLLDITPCNLFQDLCFNISIYEILHNCLFLRVSFHTLQKTRDAIK